jgi:maleylpyruvate isomerase
VSVRQDQGVTRGWMRDGEALVAAAVARLADDDLRAPSRLPDWSRAHVVGHLARNAEALARLAAWARTGVETPMYRDREQRAADIEASAGAPADVLRRELASTAEQLDKALDALDAQQWQAEVRSALGRPIPAAEIPWMRVREVWLHAVDLDAGAQVTDLPAAVVDALLDDVTGTLGARDGGLAARLEPLDRDRVWTLGSGGELVVRGTAADLLGWLTGRGDGAGLAADGGALPAAPRWL